MKATIIITLLLVLVTSCISPNYDRSTMSLSGSWKFELDEKEVGKREGWFTQTLSVGRIELTAKDKDNIASIKVYPDVDNKLVKLRLKITNPGSENLNGKIICSANGFNGNNHNVSPQSFDFSSDDQEFIIERNFEMGDDYALWDEFNTNLYTLIISLEANSTDNRYLDEAKESFGMVKFETRGTQFVVNDRITLLRGKHDACVFPLTGHPPMTKDEWVRQMKISKEYGLNHYCFHSWTPPKAAFEAADIVGIYIHPFGDGQSPLKVSI